MSQCCSDVGGAGEAPLLLALAAGPFDTALSLTLHRGKQVQQPRRTAAGPATLSCETLAATISWEARQRDPHPPINRAGAE